MAEFPNVSMGGTSDQLGSIQIYLATVITVVESTDGPVILRSHQSITYKQAKRANKN